MPVQNQIKTNQLVKYNLFDNKFWDLYQAETDESKKRQLLYTYDDPSIEKERRLLNSFGDDLYSGTDLTEGASGSENAG